VPWSTSGSVIDVPGRLIICATPIGNLGDVTSRLADALAEADIVFAEDTRRSSILLSSLGVSVPMRSLFVGNELSRSEELGDRLAAGETVALVTDAGVPGIADPGFSAVRRAIAAGAEVTVIPGPSAVTAALAVSGMGADRFVFEGFLPRKGRARQQALDRIASEGRTIVVFISPHRLLADIAFLSERLGADRDVCVCRELTKMHEEVWWGTLGQAVERWEQIGAQGEFTLVIAGKEPVAPSLEAAVQVAGRFLSEGMSRSEAAKRAAGETGIPRRDVYDALGDL